MNIGEVCTREVYIVRPAEPLADAVTEMHWRHVGAQLTALARMIGGQARREGA